MSTLTDKEIDVVLNGYGRNDFSADATWAWSVADCCRSVTTRNVGGVISSLARKGLVWSNGKGREAATGLTPAGFEALATLRAAK